MQAETPQSCTSLTAGAYAHLAGSFLTVRTGLKSNTQPWTWPVSGCKAAGFQLQVCYQHLVPSPGQLLWKGSSSPLDAEILESRNYFSEGSVSSRNQHKAALRAQACTPWWVLTWARGRQHPHISSKFRQIQGRNCTSPTVEGSTFVMQFCISIAFGKARYSLRQLLQQFRFWGRGAPTGNSFNNYTLFGQSVLQHAI